jgi:hypothetical protein
MGLLHMERESPVSAFEARSHTLSSMQEQEVSLEVV